MSWSKVSSTRWERPLDPWEGYFAFVGDTTAKLCDGREHYTIYSTIKLKLDGLSDVITALKQAWKQIRLQQPQVATTVEGMTRVYQVPDEQQLETWISSTFIVSEVKSNQELYASFQPIRKPTLYFIPSSSELVFRAPHYTIDGTGVVMFWNAYLTALASPISDMTFGSETERLAPTMEELLGHEKPSEATQPLTDKANVLFANWVGSMPALQPASGVGQSRSGPCSALDLIFSASATESIVAACKARGITVTAAVHAAYIQALSMHPGSNADVTRYASPFQYNLRQYLPGSYSTSDYAISVFYRPMFNRVDLPASYGALTKALTNCYTKPFRENTSEDLAVACRLSHVALGAIQTPEFQAAPIPSDALVSSLGIVEKNMQQQYHNGGRSITVQDFTLGVDVVQGMSMLFVHTFRERLRLNYCFNEGFEKPKDIQTYLTEMETIMVKELIG